MHPARARRQLPGSAGIRPKLVRFNDYGVLFAGLTFRFLLRFQTLA